MRYLIAILCPPLAVLLCGHLFLAILCLMLTLFFYFPGAICALLVVANHHADARNRALIHAVKARPQPLASQPTTVVNYVYVQVQPKPLFLPQPPKIVPLKPVKPPGKPLSVRIADARTLAARAGDLAISGVVQTRRWLVASYGNLPEWAQPIIWGMAAATPVVIGIAAIRFAVR